MKTELERLEIPKTQRCEYCEGRGEFPLGVCSIPGHPPEKTKPCPECGGSGLSKAVRDQIKKDERAAERKRQKEAAAK